MGQLDDSLMKAFFFFRIFTLAFGSGDHWFTGQKHYLLTLSCGIEFKNSHFVYLVTKVCTKSTPPRGIIGYQLESLDVSITFLVKFTH